jgi:MoaA/NifB/PqqE/SkfB family radical SAM enzyme
MGKPQVTVFGHGETTCRRNWQRFCGILLKKGFRLTMTTNLAKSFSDEEIDTLSRFALITISVDTVNPEDFAALRRGSKLAKVLANMQRVVSHAKKQSREAPELRWNCVVSSVVVDGLDELVKSGMKAGVGGFVFTRYNNYGHKVLGAPEILPLAEMDDAAFPHAVASLKKAVRTAKTHGCNVRTEYGLMEQIEKRLLGEKAQQAASSAPLQASDAEGPSTRFCLEPWANLSVRADGRVGACCSIRGLGKYTAATSLAEIFNSEGFQSLRQGLLSGDLGRECMECPYKTKTSPAALKAAVGSLFAGVGRQGMAEVYANAM